MELAFPPLHPACRCMLVRLMLWQRVPKLVWHWLVVAVVLAMVAVAIAVGVVGALIW